LNVGDVLRVRALLANPPKQKIVLYVGTAQKLFLWFNTEPRKRPAQMSVAPHEAPGITHDCFLDCGWVSVFSERELANAEHCGRAALIFLLRVAEEIELRAVTLAAGHRKAVVRALLAA
jgi:hypothetical protein